MGGEGGGGGGRGGARGSGASFHPCFQRAASCRCVAGGAAVAHGRQGKEAVQFGGPEKKVEGRSLWIKAEMWREPRRVQRISALADRRGQRRNFFHTSKVCPFLFLFSRRLSIWRFLLFCLAASLRAASLCCPCLTDIDADGEVCTLVCSAHPGNLSRVVFYNVTTEHDSAFDFCNVGSNSAFLR